VNKDKIDRYLDLILKANRGANIVSRRAQREDLVFHVEDSWQVAFILDEGGIEKIIDIGSGQGFPAIPMAIRWPEISITLVEANLRKAVFLKRVKIELELDNVRVIRDRAEVLAKDDEHRRRYEMVTSRAVAELSTAVRLAWPFLLPGGKAVIWKGKDWRGELEEAEKFVIERGGELANIVNYRLRDRERSLVVIRRN